MLSSTNATHLNSAGNRTKTVTLSLLLKMMALYTPETKSEYSNPFYHSPSPSERRYIIEINLPNIFAANIVNNKTLPTITSLLVIIGNTSKVTTPCAILPHPVRPHVMRKIIIKLLSAILDLVVTTRIAAESFDSLFYIFVNISGAPCQVKSCSPFCDAT